MTLDDLRDHPQQVFSSLKIAGPAGASAGGIDVSVRTKVRNHPAPATEVVEPIKLFLNSVAEAKATVGAPSNVERINVANADGPNCYWLPWGEGKAYLGQLGDRHDLFFTFTINGCGVIIAGTEAHPMVCHANLDSPRLDNAAMQNIGNPAEAGREQGTIYEQFYGNLAATLIDQQHISGVRAGKLTPQTYLLDAGAAFGAVFGVRRGGAWKFYGNWNKKTTEIWPLGT